MPDVFEMAASADPTGGQPSSIFDVANEGLPNASALLEQARQRENYSHVFSQILERRSNEWALSGRAQEMRSVTPGEWDAVKAELEQKFPGLPHDQLRPHYEQMRPRMASAGLLQQTIARHRDQPGFEDTFVHYWLPRVPLVGGVVETVEGLVAASSIRAVADGTATEADYKAAGQHIAAAERQAKRTGTLEQFWDFFSKAAPVVAEFAASGSILTGTRFAAKTAATEAAKTITRRLLENAARGAASGFLPPAVGRVTGQAAQAGVPSISIDENAASGMAVQEHGGLLGNLPQAIGEQALQGAIGAPGQVVRGPGAAVRGGIRGMAADVGVNIISTQVEQRTADAIAGFTGIRPDYGTLGDFLAGGERRDHAISHMVQEAVVFGTIHAVREPLGHGWEAINRRLDPQGTTRRQADLVRQQLEQLGRVEPDRTQQEAQGPQPGIDVPPERPPGATQPPPEAQQPAQPAQTPPERSQGPAIATPEQAAAALAAEQARQAAAGTPRPTVVGGPAESALTPREAVLGRLGNPPRPSDALPPAENKRPKGISQKALREQYIQSLMSKHGWTEQEAAQFAGPLKVGTSHRLKSQPQGEYVPPEPLGRQEVPVEQPQLPIRPSEERPGGQPPNFRPVEAPKPDVVVPAAPAKSAREAAIEAMKRSGSSDKGAESRLKAIDKEVAKTGGSERRFAETEYSLKRNPELLAYAREKFAEVANPPPLKPLPLRISDVERAAMGGLQADIPPALATAMTEHGLTERQQHIIRERYKGRSLSEIASDPIMLKKDGEPYSRQRIKQLEQEILPKMGESGSMTQLIERHRTAHEATLAQMEGGKGEEAKAKSQRQRELLEAQDKEEQQAGWPANAKRWLTKHQKDLEADKVNQWAYGQGEAVSPEAVSHLEHFANEIESASRRGENPTHTLAQRFPDIPRGKIADFVEAMKKAIHEESQAAKATGLDVKSVRSAIIEGTRGYAESLRSHAENAGGQPEAAQPVQPPGRPEPTAGAAGTEQLGGPPAEPHGPAMQPGQAQLLEHLRFKHGAGSMAEEFAGGGQSMMPAEPHEPPDWQPKMIGAKGGRKGALTLPPGLKVIADMAAWTKEAIGKGREWLRDTGGVEDSLRSTLAPATRTSQSQEAVGTLREQLSKLAHKGVVAQEALRQAGKYFETWVVNAPDATLRQERFLEITDAIEGGNIASLPPEIRDFAETIRRLTDQRTELLRDKGIIKSFIENYFGHVWEAPGRDAASIGAELVGRKPLAGSEGFKRKREIPTYREGIEDHNLTPKTWNPVDLALLKLREMDKSIMYHDVAEEFKSAGLMKFFKLGDRPPQGWIQVQDKSARVLAPAKPGDAGPALVGHYYMPEPVAKLVNNYLSEGLYKNSRVYDVAREFSNMMNQFQLGFSAFHAGFVFMDAQISGVALALNQATRGDFAEAAKSLAKSTISPWRTLVLGNKVLKEGLSPGTQGAEIAAIVEAMEKGGGRLKMEEFYGGSHLGAFLKAIGEVRAGHKDKIGSALYNALPALADAISKPVMEMLVPRMKLGVFADMARYEMSKGTDTREALGKAWDSVDNRLGQLAYDNLFWNRTFKDILLLGVRSVGWNVGTTRELGGGLMDVPASLQGLREGKGISHRTAYVVALPMVAALYGAIYQYLATGKAPESTEDYFFPRTGGVKPDGSPDRIALPTYMRDVAAVTHRMDRGVPQVIQNVWDTAKGKLNPGITTVVEMLNNKDFRDHPIRNPQDSTVQQASDMALHLLSQFESFSSRTLRQRLGEGAGIGSSLQGLVGISSAPGRVTSNPEINDYYELLHQLQRDRLEATRKGLPYPRETEYRTLEHFKPRMDRITEMLHGERKIGGRLRPGEQLDDRTRSELNQMRIEISRIANQAARQR